MIRITVILVSLCALACGKSGAGDADSCGTKSVFSDWVNDGGGHLNLSSLHYGSNAGQLVVSGITCNVTAEIAGNECSGVITVTRSTVADPNVLTTYCADLVGTFEWSRERGNLVFGRRGSAPLAFH